MKYNIKKINEFLENDDTDLSWNDFSKMIINKFGKTETLEGLMTALCTETKCDFISQKRVGKIQSAIEILNREF